MELIGEKNKTKYKMVKYDKLNFEVNGVKYRLSGIDISNNTYSIKRLKDGRYFKMPFKKVKKYLKIY